MPLRVNYTGVMPVIFAQAILMFPGMIFQKLGLLYNLPFLSTLGGLFSQASWFYILAEAFDDPLLFFVLLGTPSSMNFRWPMTSKRVEATSGSVPVWRPATSCTGP